MTLVVAMVSSVALATMLFALVTLATTEPLIANNLLQGSQAFYVAESGLEIALAHLNAGVPPEGVYTLALGTVHVTYESVDADHVRVRSQGQVEGATRLVSNQFVREDGRWGPMKEFKEEAE
jgi:hypothetical protein